MPIANCLLCDPSIQVADDIVETWSNESGVSAEHMTVNCIPRVQQFGRSYKIMGTLYLPTAWEAEAVDSLQIGLSRSLAKCCKLELSEIHVVTLRVASGMVVENGLLETW